MFVDQSKEMASVYPYLSEDVLCRVELLNAKWEILQMNAITTKKSGTKANNRKSFTLSGNSNNARMHTCEYVMKKRTRA